METMAISKFKATCLAVLQRVRTTGQPVRITRRGEPVADVVPPGPPERPERWLGAMSGRARITGDITTPTSELVPWDIEEE
ncbi:MAG: type II toxin-antitoxin system prevent-host-death family antitoxin [Acidobacteria bacterium]|nr:type II toxin-antitoxin system prevent-host-death family antitoxin [Acidobacteriota bacterium]